MSLEKSHIEIESHQQVFSLSDCLESFTRSLELKSMDELYTIEQNLKELACIDLFQRPLELNKKTKQTMKTLGISELEDPYLLTNILLQFLDMVENKIKKKSS